MKKYIIIISTFFLLLAPGCVISQTIPIEVTVTWDADSYIENQNAKWEKLYFFIADTPDGFNYDKPDLILDQTYVNGKSVPVITQISFDAVLHENKSYYAVVRAYATIGGEASFSADSEPADWSQDLTKPVAVTLSVEIVDEDYLFFWNSPIDDRVVEWKLKWSYELEGEYTTVRIIPKEPGPLVSIPVTDFWPDTDEHEVIYATLTQYTKWGVESIISNKVILERPVIITVNTPKSVRVIVINKQ